MKDKARCGRPHTTTTPQSEVRLDGLICADRRITVNEMREELGVGNSEVETMLSSLGYSKVCARWLPKMLTQDQKDQRRDVCQDLLDRYEAEGDGFLDRVVTDDETYMVSPLRAKVQKAVDGMAPLELSSKEEVQDAFISGQSDVHRLLGQPRRSHPLGYSGTRGDCKL